MDWADEGREGEEMKQRWRQGLPGPRFGALPVYFWYNLNPCLEPMPQFIPISINFPPFLPRSAQSQALYSRITSNSPHARSLTGCNSRNGLLSWRAFRRAIRVLPTYYPHYLDPTAPGLLHF